MPEQVAVDLLINTGNSAKTVSEIKQSIKDIRNAALQAGEGSKDFVKLTNAAAGLKDKLEDVNDGIAALDPGKLGANFARLGSSIAGGFQAAQGAMALFGKSGEDVQKTLLKVQAATAFAQGIQSVQDMGKAFKAFWLVLRANPLGLILTSVTALVGLFVLLKDKVEIFGKAFDFVSGIVSKGVQVFKNLSDSIGLSSFKLDELKDKTKEYYATAERLTKKNADLEIKNIDREIALRKSRNQQTFDLEKEKELIIYNSLNKQYGFAKAQGKDLTEISQQLFDSANNLLIIKANREKYYNDLAKKQREEDLKDKQDKIKASDEADIAQGIIRAERRAKEQEELDLTAQIEAEGMAQNKKLNAEAGSDLLAQDEANAAARLTIEQSLFSSLSSLGDIFISDSQKLAKYKKTQALIDIGIDTAKAIASLTANSEANTSNAVTFGGAGIIQFATGLARILANISKAKQLLSSPSAPSPSLGGGGREARNTPVINPVTGNTQTLLPQQQIESSTSGGQLLRAYVVETEITDTQKRINSIKNKSIIG